MNFRTVEISSAFSRWLERFSPPQSMRDKPQAMQDEVDALLRVLLKFAPGSEYMPWLHKALDQVEYQMKTRAWPTKGELGAVCANLRKERAATAEPVVFDPYEITARRMQAGGPVAEGYLYGREACELIRRGLVDRETMTRYRSYAFLARKAMYGEEAALRWEAEQQEIHERSKAMTRDTQPARSSVVIPDKTAAPAYSEVDL